MIINDKNGFTLVELMVIVIVIGIFVAIIIPAYVSSQEKAAKNACLYNQKIIHSAAEEYNTNNGTYPVNVQKLVDEGYLEVMPNCSGLNYNTINVDGFVECPKTTDKHINP